MYCFVGRGRMLSNIFFIIFLIFPLSLFGNIDKYLNYYETLHHDSFKHHIVRRDLYSENPMERLVEFDSHGRHFRLVLHKKTSLVSEDFEVTVVNENGGETFKFEPAVYHGYVEDEPTTSSVDAYWDEDANEITATISTESDTFAIEPSWRHLPVSDDYNLISYKASDMKESENSKPQTCANTAKKVMNEYDRDETGSRNKRRDKRSISFSHKTCTVRLVADHRFYEVIGHFDKFKTTRYLMGLMSWVDGLFKEETFNECGSGFGFEVQNVTIHEVPSIDYNADHRWKSSERLLEAFTNSTYSQRNSDFCLAHLFTALGFDTNIFGIAYIGDRASKRGGLCSQPPSAPNNTGWTTFVDQTNNPITTLQAQLVTAHEFGHGWGSHHDPFNSSCAPGDLDGGKYIMYTSTVNGLQINNRRFSSCSKSEICSVLKYRANDCFKDRSPAKCGDYIAEGNETCDEGLKPRAVRCCTEKCKLQEMAACSDWNHDCCVNCQFADSSKVCHVKHDKPCTETTYCTGNSSRCPKPAVSADGTVCMTDNGVRGTCRNSTCVSLCEEYGLTPCLCDAVNISCHVCCRNSTSGSICEEFFNDTFGEPFEAPNNTPCPIGICINGTCQKLTDTSLVRPWNFIHFESVAAFVKFMKDNIVGSVIIISLLLWIPASCGVSYIDRKRARDEFEDKWHTTIMSHLIATSEHSLTKIKRTEVTIDRRKINKMQRLNS